MTTFIEKLKNEPAVVVGTIVAALALVGIALDPAYVEALVVVLPLIGALVTRSKVTPTNAYTDIETEGHPGNPLG